MNLEKDMVEYLRNIKTEEDLKNTNLWDMFTKFNQYKLIDEDVNKVMNGLWQGFNDIKSPYRHLGVVSEDSYITANDIKEMCHIILLNNDELRSKLGVTGVSLFNMELNKICRGYYACEHVLNKCLLDGYYFNYKTYFDKLPENIQNIWIGNFLIKDKPALYFFAMDVIKYLLNADSTNYVKYHVVDMLSYIGSNTEFEMYLIRDTCVKLLTYSNNIKDYKTEEFNKFKEETKAWFDNRISTSLFRFNPNCTDFIFELFLDLYDGIYKKFILGEDIENKIINEEPLNIGGKDE